MHRCPTREELRQWSEDPLGDSTIEGHVEACATCQALLDVITTVKVWPHASSLPPLAPQLPFLEQLAAQPPSPSDWEDEQSETAAAHPVIPGYEVIRELGRGGMGVVWLARHRELDRLTAVKLLSPQLEADPEYLKRFRQEAQLLARLNHPGIVQVYDIGRAEGRNYLALEYVAGGSMADYLRRHSPSPGEAVFWLAQIAQAVGAAHDKGIIHRDLKPQNVLLDGTTAKVADFGLARVQNAEASHTVSGIALGTPRYMAPEQASGKSRLQSPATDVYALGVILYEMITGQPFIENGSFLEMLQRVGTVQPEPLHKRVPGVPRSLSEICVKCLSKAPNDRYPSATALAECLVREASEVPQVGDVGPRAIPRKSSPLGASARPTTDPHVLSRHLLKALIGVVLLSVLIWLATIAGGISPWTTDPLPVNSQWSGSFAFHPGTLDDPDGDVQLLVTDRQGTSFRGVYETENKTYAWRVQGTLIHSQIRWEFVEAIRDSAEANVVGYAFVDGTLKDEMMTVTFRQPHEASVAAMRLQLRE